MARETSAAIARIETRSRIATAGLIASRWRCGGRVQVRAPRVGATAIANHPVARSADHSASDDILAALHTPLLSTGLPIRVSSYVMQDADRAKVRLLLAAEAGDAVEAVRMGIGYELRDSSGDVAVAGPATLRPDATGAIAVRGVLGGAGRLHLQSWRSRTPPATSARSITDPRATERIGAEAQNCC